MGRGQAKWAEAKGVFARGIIQGEPEPIIPVKEREKQKMKLFDGVISITGITFLVFSGFVIIFFGYLLGRVRIKGVGLGTAGVFIVALLFGIMYSTEIGQIITQTVAGEKVDISMNALKVIDTTGLVLFVGAVGLIAGPNFFKNFKKNFKYYILIGIVITAAGVLTTVLCFYIGRGAENSDQEFISALSGIMSGALTNTPAFSSAKTTAATVAAGSGSALSVADAEAIVSVGYGIAYLFGVIGVVLFVQLIPRITKANMNEEREKIRIVDTGTSTLPEKGFEVEPKGLFVFAFVVAAGILIGAIRIPLTPEGYSGATFSLTSTGGTLLVGLIVGHFGHIGPVGVNLSQNTLTALRELGLVLFLVGAGVAGGMKFVQYFKWVYFFYGVAITLVPMIVGYLFTKHVLKLSLLNNLGAIAGGMTSTPALGSLIAVAGTDDVASAYAATYPIALIGVVISSQFLILLLA